jgi:hypothetical protein
MEQRWNDTDRGKPEDLEKNLPQYQSVTHKSYMDWPRGENGKKLSTNRLSYGTAKLSAILFFWEKYEVG